VTQQLELTALKRDWIESAIPTVKMFFSGHEFTADDLHPVLDKPEQPNWFGVLIAAMKRRGLIVETGYIVSARPERNKSRILRWKCL
jgi:hypothetical protein